MTSKRQLKNAESSSSKRPQKTTLPTILSYFKSHYTYQTFNSKDLLLLLDCNTPETAKSTAEDQLNSFLNQPNLKDEVKTFISKLLIDGLICLQDSNAALYWEEKKSKAALLLSSHKQLQVYHGVSAQVMEQELLTLSPDNSVSLSPVNSPYRSLSPASSAETNSLTENIWSIWSEVLHDILTEDHGDIDINQYSLEYLGIITLGDHIGNKQSRQFYPKELVSKTNKTIQMPIVDVFRKYSSFYSPFFQSLSVSLDSCHTLLLKNSLKVKNSPDPGLQLTFDFFMTFITQILDKRDVLSKLESVYNFRAIFRFLDAVVFATPSCTFIPGEVRLQAIHKELERLEMSTKSFYNADGIIIDNDTGLELCLLETSGPFGLVNLSRETNDNVKAAYGLLSMLHTVAYKYIHCDIQLFKKLNIFFVHAAQDRVRLWSFCLIEKELYVLNRVDTAILPTGYSGEFKDEFKHLVNLFWMLKVLLDSSKSTLDEIEASHTKNQVAYRDGHVEHLPRLDEFLVESAEIKLSSRISQVSEIYISSSPIRPDSPY